MALKANRVGVAPTEVDELGHIKGGEVPSNVLTTNDVIDALNQRERTKPLSANQGVELNGRLGNVESKLKIPNEDERFFFAKENDKYGFRLTQNGDFHPFSSGVSESGLYVANPIQTGIGAYTNVEVVSGGYEKVGNTTYFVVTIKPLVDLAANTNLLDLRSASTGDTFTLISSDDFYFSGIDLRAKRTLTANEELTFKAIRQ